MLKLTQENKRRMSSGMGIDEDTFPMHMQTCAHTWTHTHMVLSYSLTTVSVVAIFLNHIDKCRMGIAINTT